MHREISHADRAFHRESNYPLYLMTALLGLLMAYDLWPAFAGWIAPSGISLPTWPREILGCRIMYLPAILGGARVFQNSLENLLKGRLSADLAIAIACVAAIL